MQFAIAGYSDVGRVKETNQDSYVAKVASTNFGDVALVAVADGMGGLNKGELASATVARVLSTWFSEKLPTSLETMGSSVEGFDRFVEGQWAGIVQDLNLHIMRYGLQNQIALGTTLTAMLAIGARYTIIHVGDSRAYEIDENSVQQITEDQTFVHREVAAGRMSAQEALTHPQRNVLLQCIGSSKEVRPQVVHGVLRPGANYLLCSDGFRHVLTDDELVQKFSGQAIAAVSPEHTTAPAVSPQVSADDARAPFVTRAQAALADAVNLVMERKERDNITACLLGVRKGGEAW